MKKKLLAELKNWRAEVIDDQGVSETFRAVGAFPGQLPSGYEKVDAWVEENLENFDFNSTGWPAWSPTRAIQEWKHARAIWEPHVMWGPEQSLARPALVHSKKRKKMSK